MLGSDNTNLRLVRSTFFLSTAIMGFQSIWYSHPRRYGPGSRYCRVCNNTHGLIRKYGLNICRRCFRQYAADIGFKKLD
ncbi:40S ribosomal protein S29 [Pomacea canaliculata]|uniref:40S ribosomal protein S29 n=1 Tax=Pomacea canaliculata TaxID=400727 RepID=UPI000D733EE4|nr:40S ribosomal protein S29 [Pomacea canaliculata]